MAALQGPITASQPKITKPRSKMVKPILKKISHSEKNSLDLDRPWEDQQINQGWGDVYDAGSAGRSVRDVSFSFSDGIGNGNASGSRPRFQHARSTSGNSVATNGSGGPRFVHPFQQMPRTSTPPLSYANSMASFDNNARDYSPTITENEDDDDFSNPHSLPRHPHSHSVSHTNLRRPSLASQRTSSFSDITTAPQLRSNTSRSLQSYSRLAHGNLTSSLSHSDLHLNLTLSSFDSPSTSAPTIPPAVASPISSSSVAPMSPLRSSLEGVGLPRLRSRSEVDAGARAEHVREARRKFEARERAKDEKHDREMLKKRERRDHKEAKEIERQGARKNSTTGSDIVRPPASRKTTPTGTGSAARVSEGYGRSKPSELGEKQVAFMSSNYESMAGGTTPSFGPGVDDVRFQGPKRTNTAKRKTQGYWTGFILWVRTRLFRLGRK